MFFFAGCSSSLYSEYTLTKKYPRDMPDLELKILNDTTGIVMQKDDNFIKQDFRFIKEKKNFLVITYIDDTHNLVSLKKGDTVVYYKKELYLINKYHKLIFDKKD